MKGFSLYLRQSENLLSNYDEQWDDKSAPESGYYVDASAIGSDGIYVAIAYRRHCYDYAPDSTEIVVEVELFDSRVVLNLKHSKTVGDDKDRKEQGDTDRVGRVCLQQALKSKSHIGWEAITAAKFLRVNIHVHIVIEDSAHDEENSEKHKDQENVTGEEVDRNFLTFVFYVYGVASE